MVQSRAATVDDYLAQVSPARRTCLGRLRDLARGVLDGHEERMQWGMPVYALDEKICFGFAEQKQFMSLYFMDPSILDQHAAAIAGVPRGKSCLRFRRPEALDWAVIEDLLVAARAASPGA